MPSLPIPMVAPTSLTAPVRPERQRSMRSAPLRKLIVVTCLWGLVTGCAAGIPPQLAGQVSWNLGFPDIRRYPEAYRGRVVALGGIVAHVEAVDEGYRASVSELPFESSSRYRPAVDQLPRG